MTVSVQEHPVRIEDEYRVVRVAWRCLANCTTRAVSRAIGKAFVWQLASNQIARPEKRDATRAGTNVSHQSDCVKPQLSYLMSSCGGEPVFAKGSSKATQPSWIPTSVHICAYSAKQRCSGCARAFHCSRGMYVLLRRVNAALRRSSRAPDAGRGEAQAPLQDLSTPEEQRVCPCGDIMWPMWQDRRPAPYDELLRTHSMR